MEERRSPIRVWSAWPSAACVLSALAGGALVPSVAMAQAPEFADAPIQSAEQLIAPEAMKLLRASGSVAASEGVLNLRVGDVRVSDLPDVLVAARKGERVDLDGVRSRVHVLVTRGVLSPQQRAELDALGVRRMGHLPSHAWIVDLSALTLEGLSSLARLDFVSVLTPYQDAWKVDPWLLAGAHARTWQTPFRQALARRDEDLGGRVAATIHAFANQPRDQVIAALEAINGIEIYSSERVLDNWSISVSLPSHEVARLAGLAPVQFAEMTPEYTQRSNSTTRWLVQSNQQSETPLYSHGLMGQGQIVGFMDFGLAWEHCSFSDSVNPIGPNHRKIVAYNAPLMYDLHGTHVAGTLLGDGGNTGNTRGVAYQARLAFSTTPSVEEASHLARYELHATQGAFIHSNSWGADFFTEYDGGARAIDAFSWTNDDALICFSVSNQSTLGNPENAKNCLAVSLTANAPYQDEMPCGGASGPTIDGRRKPEMVAPGCSITSSAGASTGSCGVTTRTGTSMAQPAVAAVAVLTRQYFTEGFYPSGSATASDAMIPSGALIKAMLAACGQDLTSVPGYPNMREGFGRVRADSSLYFDGDSTELVVQQAFNQSAGSLDQGQAAVFQVDIDDDDRDLKIMLAWHDFPATLGATYAPVNDLDLVAISPDGKTFYGNAFDNDGRSLTADQGATRDCLNNLEGLVVTSPERGVWTIRVEGSGINEPGQGYGLVMTGKVHEVPPADCIADFDQDGGVTNGDIGAFFYYYERGLPEADVDGSGGIEPMDISVFFAHFEAGC